jgi:Domain of unknown function (DUF4375)
MTDNDTPLLVDLGTNAFIPAEQDACYRWHDYSTAFIWNNEALLASMDEGDDWPAPELRLLSRMTRGQRLLYVLSTFDGQVNNGGVAQFLFNRGHLAEEVLAALRHLGLNDLEGLLGAAVAQADPESVADARQVFSEEAIKSGDGSVSPRAHAAYEEERLKVERVAKELEDGWYPKWGDGSAPPTGGPLRVAMCEAMNAYIAAHPGEFQLLRS